MAISRCDEYKQIQKECEALADAKIRHDAEVSGEKITEKMVESQKLLDRKVIEAKDALFKSAKQVGELEALKDAYSARGYAIRDLIQLYLANYYGSNMEASGSGMARANADQIRRERRA